MDPNIRLIATCGINCQLCKAFQRSKNNCCGCNIEGANKPKYCFSCKIKHCSELTLSEKKYCYVCEKFPCKRLEHLDKRYRTKYRLSVIESLNLIEKHGAEQFISLQLIKWQCHNCGNMLSMHSKNCLYCDGVNPNFPGN